MSRLLRFSLFLLFALPFTWQTTYSMKPTNQLDNQLSALLVATASGFVLPHLEHSIPGTQHNLFAKMAARYVLYFGRNTLINICDPQPTISTMTRAGNTALEVLTSLIDLLLTSNRVQTRYSLVNGMMKYVVSPMVATLVASYITYIAQTIKNRTKKMPFQAPVKFQVLSSSWQQPS